MELDAIGVGPRRGFIPANERSWYRDGVSWKGEESGGWRVAQVLSMEMAAYATKTVALS